MTTYEIKLPQFEGAFDLLLFFIERDELNIHDIPISKLTNDFLAYLKALQTLNIDVASEFILVASTLMKIKAKMLLPRKELDDKGNEIDPRQDFVERLLEYKKYKSIVVELGTMETNRLNLETRGNLLEEIEAMGQENSYLQELSHLDLYKLLKAFQKAITRFETSQKEHKHIVLTYPYTIETQKKYLLSLVNLQEKTYFTQIIAACRHKIEAIYTFLALLELVQYQQLSMIMDEGINNFCILAYKSDKNLLI